MPRKRGSPSFNLSLKGIALALAVLVGLVIWRSHHLAKPKEMIPEAPTTSQRPAPLEIPKNSAKTIERVPDQSVAPPLQSAPPENWGLPSLLPRAPETPLSDETPAQSLIRLREALAKGDYSELPVGTRTRGNCHFFYVSSSTNWQSARRMARAFGGDLAIVDGPTRLWLGQMIPPVTVENPEKRLIWIGATRTNPEAWHWVSSIRWQPSSPITGSGDFAAIDQQGLARARAISDQHPFFIQWYHDGSNPTEIRSLLAITKESLAEENPHFPIGTETLEDRRLLLIKETCSYSEALELAEVAGAKLMSVATSTEANWLASHLKKVDAPNGLWLGATMTAHAWTWNDAQPWEFARWSDSSQPGANDYLLARAGAGWDAEKRNYKASGLLLEWSDETPAAHRFRPEADQLEFTDRARELLAEFQNIRSKAAKANTDTYLWQLDLWLRRRKNQSEIARWTPRVRTVKKAVRGSRLPSDIPKLPSRTYPGEIHELARHHLKKQVEIDKQFFAKAQSIRDSYVERLDDEVTKAKAIGQREAAVFFHQKIAGASDIQAWTESLGF